jgi:hypothetical protein
MTERSYKMADKGTRKRVETDIPRKCTKVYKDLLSNFEQELYRLPVYMQC